MKEKQELFEISCLLSDVCGFKWHFTLKERKA